jgi:hypothetical protein
LLQYSVGSHLGVAELNGTDAWQISIALHLAPSPPHKHFSVAIASSVQAGGSTHLPATLAF